jgi:hypothetical protein
LDEDILKQAKTNQQKASWNIDDNDDGINLVDVLASSTAVTRKNNGAYGSVLNTFRSS